MNRNITNWLLTQALWFACVLGGDLWALLAAACYLQIYAILIGHLKQEWPGILIIASIGFGTDMLLSGMNLIKFHSDFSIPLWLMVLWFGFATLFYHGLTWLNSKPLLTTLLGAVAGPVAYFAGAHLSHSEITVSLPMFILSYALLWAIYLPLFLFIASKSGALHPAATARL